jgi:hypothetical protein
VIYGKTICRCPVCHEVIDIVTHYTPDHHGQSMAMIVQDSRWIHADKSPQCVGKPGWERGWDEEPAAAEGADHE